MHVLAAMPGGEVPSGLLPWLNLNGVQRLFFPLCLNRRDRNTGGPDGRFLPFLASISRFHAPGGFAGTDADGDVPRAEDGDVARF
jgi:hypothetical protein